MFNINNIPSNINYLVHKPYFKELDMHTKYKFDKLNTQINCDYYFKNLEGLTKKEAYEKGKQDGKQKKIQDAYDKGFREGRGGYYSNTFFTTL